MTVTETPHRDGFPAWTRDTLRYGDTDRQGHVNNAVFVTFLESGRTALLYDGSDPLWEPDCSFVIARLVLDFHGEILWPGEVDIGTRVASIGRSSMTFAQAIFQGDRCVATGETVIVQMDERTRRSHPLSARTVERLQHLRVPSV